MSRRARARTLTTNGWAALMMAAAILSAVAWVILVAAPR